MKIASKLTLIAALTGALFATSAPTPAQEKITLRAADYLSPTHYMIRFGVKHWIDTVSKMSNGRVEIRHFPSEQLGKAADLLSLVQAGTVDVSGVIPSFVSERMPLSTIGELPDHYRDACHGTKATADLLMNDGILAKMEQETNNVVVLFTIATPSYTIFSKRDKLASIDAIKGMKLRTLGGIMSSSIEKLGAVGVQMASPEIYESLSRGTVDGLVYTHSAVVSGGMHKLVKSALSGINFGGANFNYTMGKQRWNSLAPDVQKILLAAGRETMKFACAEIDKDTEVARKKIVEAGIQFFEIPAAEKPRVNRALDEVTEDWVRDRAKRNKAAGDVYKAFRAAIARYPD